MTSIAFQNIADELMFLPDWEERYGHIIALGKAMAPLEDAYKVTATRVEGCASQVWLTASQASDGRWHMRGDSDALIVRGLVALILALFDGLSSAEILAVDAPSELKRLGLDANLSSQRSNGLRAMVARIRKIAQDAEAEARAAS